MKYMGSKARIAKYLLPIILKNRKPDQWYVEPFVGGANMIDKVGGRRIGSDVNEPLIEALKLIRDNPNSLPNLITESLYNLAKSDKEGVFFTKAELGYIGFALSYGGKYFGGWRRDKEQKRNYVKEAFKNAIKQSPYLKGIKFISSSYSDLEIPPKSVIYVDPPYTGTTVYKAEFDHDQFWRWCREKTIEGHDLFVSEYSAPDEFICIWEKEINSSLTKNTGAKKATEKLFIYPF